MTIWVYCIFFLLCEWDTTDKVGGSSGHEFKSQHYWAAPVGSLNKAINPQLLSYINVMTFHLCHKL